jgi:hypothetical protein
MAVLTAALAPRKAEIVADRHRQTEQAQRL